MPDRPRNCSATDDDPGEEGALDNRPFDAIIRDHSVSPPSDLMVEITSARDPKEHLRTEYFVRYVRQDYLPFRLSKTVAP